MIGGVGRFQWAVGSGQLTVGSEQSAVGGHKVISFWGGKKRRAKGIILWGVRSWQSAVGSGQLAVFSPILFLPKAKKECSG